MSNCPYCGKKIPMSKAFCSKSCKENYFQMVAIQIPQPFLKRIFIFCTLAQRDTRRAFEFWEELNPQNHL